MNSTIDSKQNSKKDNSRTDSKRKDVAVSQDEGLWQHSAGRTSWMLNLLLPSSSKSEVQQNTDNIKFTSFPAPSESKKKSTLLTGLSLLPNDPPSEDEEEVFTQVSSSQGYSSHTSKSVLNNRFGNSQTQHLNPLYADDLSVLKKEPLMSTLGSAKAGSTASMPSRIVPFSREYWMPDRLCRMCYECELPFNVFRRKHHCRFCGQIFCHSCSSYFVDGRLFLLIGMVRACRLCHNQIVNNQERLTDSSSGSIAAYRQRQQQEQQSQIIDHQDEVTSRAILPQDTSFVSASLYKQMNESLIGKNPHGTSVFKKTNTGTTDVDDGRRLMLKLNSSRRIDQNGVDGRIIKEEENIIENTDTQMLHSRSTAPSAQTNALRIMASERLEYMVNQLLHSDWSLRKQPLNVWSRTVLHLAQHVCNTIDPDVRMNEDDMDVRRYVKIKTIPGGSSKECVYVDGIVFRKDVVHKNMRKSACNPRILLIAGGIEFQRSHSKMSTFSTLMEQEQKYTQIIVEKIVRLEPQVVLVGQNISRQAQECLCKHDIIVLQHVKMKVMHKIARLTSSRIFTSTDHVASMGQHIHTSLGSCHRFQAVAFPTEKLLFLSNDTENKKLVDESIKSSSLVPQVRRVRGHGYINLIYFTGCPRNLGCTLLLRGANKSVLGKIKSIISFTIFLAYHLRLECSYLSDRCAFINLPQYDSNPSFNRKFFVSISLAVDFKFTELFSASLHEKKQHDKAIHQWGWCESSPYYHQSIFVTTLWMQQQTQLSPAVVRGYVYYTAHDICLGQFLLEICHDSRVNTDAKRSCDLKQLIYHKDGILEITLRRGSDSILSVPQSSSQETNIEQNDTANIFMWSHCKKCECTRDKCILSEDSWRMSFGKFIEITFYNHLAVCNSSTCQHKIHGDHILFFGWRSYVIQIEYFDTKLMSIHQCQPFDTMSYQKELADKCSDFQSIAQCIHQTFLEKAHELRLCFLAKKDSLILYASTEPNSDETNDDSSVLNDISNVKSDIEYILSAIDLLKAEIQSHGQWIDNYIKSELMNSEANTSVLVGYPSKLRRALLMRATNWNRRLSLLGQFVNSMDQNQINFALKEASSTTSGNNSNAIGSISMLSELERLQAFTDTTSILSSKLDEYSNASTYEDVEDFHFGISNEDDIDYDKFNTSNESGEVKNDVPENMSVADEETNVLNFVEKHSAVDSAESNDPSRKDSSVTIEKSDSANTVVGTKRNDKLYHALAQIFRENNSEDDPWVVALSDLQTDCYPLDRVQTNDNQNEIMLVHEEQLTSIISYSLSTTFYKKSLEKLIILIESQNKTDKHDITDNTVLFDRRSKYALSIGSEKSSSESTPVNSDIPNQNKIDQLEHSEFISSTSKGGSLVKDCTPSQIGFHINSVLPEESGYSNGTAQLLNDSHVPRLEMLMLSASKTHVKHRFADVDAHGNTTCKFVCHAYWAAQFSAIRKAYFGDNTNDEVVFLRSLSMVRPWNAQGGKSGATFLKTTDGRFVVKRITRTELQMFLEYAPAYFEYQYNTLFKKYATVLVKVLGVFQIGSHNRITGRRVMEQVVIMQNLFYERSIRLVFDLKGSTRSRYTRIASTPELKSTLPNMDSSPSSRVVQSAAEAQPVLLDENFLEFSQGKPLPIRDTSRQFFTNAVLNDTLFLSLINVVDYSILVGIDEEQRHLFVGIIDYMRQYDIIKKVERMGKSVGMIAGQAEPTVIQPPNYKNRFQAAMHRYFMMVPDKLTPFRMGWANTVSTHDDS